MRGWRWPQPRPTRDRARSKITAEVRYRKVAIDPWAELDIAGPVPADRRGPRATERQAEVLERAGFTGAATLSRREAGALLDELTSRRRKGLCTIKQARALASRGLRRDLTFDQARAAMDALASSSWRVTPAIAEAYGAP